MKLIQGQNIINELTKSINKDDKTTSSYWKKYHSNFSFENGNLKGLGAFGSNKKPFNLIEKLIYYNLNKLYLKHSLNKTFTKQVLKSAYEICNLQRGGLDINIVRQVLTIDKLNFNNVFKEAKIAVVIGDGFGAMTSLLLKNNLVEKVILVNLTKTLLVDMIYLKRVFKNFDSDSILINDDKDLNLVENFKIIAIQADNYHFLKKIKKDLVINISSFQEMDIEVINNYMNYLYFNKNPFSFYLCNRIEKILPDGSLIKFSEYGLSENDDIIFDELCVWHQDFYRLSPPFIVKFDGPHLHQLRRCNFK